VGDVVKNLVVCIFVLASVLYLAACADTVSATPNEINILQGFSILDSDPTGRMAEEHCAQFEKHARLVGKTGRIARFACVTK
jgi:hypothetical protein